MNLNNKITQRQWRIAMFMIIVWLLFSLFMFFYFKKVCEIAEENPLEYAARKYDIDSCSCFTASGDNLFFNKTAAWRIGRRRELG